MTSKQVFILATEALSKCLPKTTADMVLQVTHGSTSATTWFGVSIYTPQTTHMKVEGN